MEEVLIEFINTLDTSFKKLQKGESVSQLTISQFQYIDAIHQLQQPTITEVAEKLTITKASVTAGINKLIQKGYVIKIQSHEDKRVFRVSLTETGKQLIEAKYLALKEYGDFITAALTEDEAREFKAIMIKLVQLFRQN
jgi:DNA-binding MarR family transcriptional regulator